MTRSTSPTLRTEPAPGCLPEPQSRRLARRALDRVADVMLDRATLTGIAAVALWLATRAGDVAPPCSRGVLPPPIVAEPVAAYSTVVTGTVLDPEGHAIAGARVLARVAEDEPTVAERAAITDAAGHFELIGLPPGRYAFVALHADTPGGSSPILRLADNLDLDIIVDLRPILL